jgi:hypothetical protein
VIQQRQMAVRMARMLTMAAVTVAAGTGIGCGSSVGPNGAWAGCSKVALPSEAQVTRIVQLRHPGIRPLSVTQRNPALVRRWFRDACAIMGHPYLPPSGSAWSCAADVGLFYEGVFYARDRRVAVLTYKASGCEGFTMSVGTDQISTDFMGPGAAAASRFDADLAAVFGVRPRAIHQLPAPPIRPPRTTTAARPQSPA